MNFNIYEKYNNVQNLMHYDMIIYRVKKKNRQKARFLQLPSPEL